MMSEPERYRSHHKLLVKSENRWNEHELGTKDGRAGDPGSKCSYRSVGPKQDSKQVQPKSPVRLTRPFPSESYNLKTHRVHARVQLRKLSLSPNRPYFRNQSRLNGHQISQNGSGVVIDYIDLEPDNDDSNNNPNSDSNNNGDVSDRNNYSHKGDSVGKDEGEVKKDDPNCSSYSKEAEKGETDSYGRGHAHAALNYLKEINFDIEQYPDLNLKKLINSGGLNIKLIKKNKDAPIIGRQKSVNVDEDMRTQIESEREERAPWEISQHNGLGGEARNVKKEEFGAKSSQSQVLFQGKSEIETKEGAAESNNRAYKHKHSPKSSKQTESNQVLLEGKFPDQKLQKSKPTDKIQISNLSDLDQSANIVKLVSVDVGSVEVGSVALRSVQVGSDDVQSSGKEKPGRKNKTQIEEKNLTLSVAGDSNSLVDQEAMDDQKNVRDSNIADAENYCDQNESDTVFEGRKASSAYKAPAAAIEVEKLVSPGKNFVTQKLISTLSETVLNKNVANDNSNDELAVQTNGNDEDSYQNEARKVFVSAEVKTDVSFNIKCEVCKEHNSMDEGGSLCGCDVHSTEPQNLTRSQTVDSVTDFAVNCFESHTDEKSQPFKTSERESEVELIELESESTNTDRRSLENEREENKDDFSLQSDIIIIKEKKIIHDDKISTNLSTESDDLSIVYAKVVPQTKVPKRFRPCVTCLPRVFLKRETSSKEEELPSVLECCTGDNKSTRDSEIGNKTNCSDGFSENVRDEVAHSSPLECSTEGKESRSDSGIRSKTVCSDEFSGNESDEVIDSPPLEYSTEDHESRRDGEIGNKTNCSDGFSGNASDKLVNLSALECSSENSGSGRDSEIRNKTNCSDEFSGNKSDKSVNLSPLECSAEHKESKSYCDVESKSICADEISGNVSVKSISLSPLECSTEDNESRRDSEIGNRTNCLDEFSGNVSDKSVDLPPLDCSTEDEESKSDCEVRNKSICADEFSGNISDKSVSLSSLEYSTEDSESRRESEIGNKTNYLDVFLGNISDKVANLSPSVENGGKKENTNSGPVTIAPVLYVDLCEDSNSQSQNQNPMHIEQNNHPADEAINDADADADANIPENNDILLNVPENENETVDSSVSCSSKNCDHVHGEETSQETSQETPCQKPQSDEAVSKMNVGSSNIIEGTKKGDKTCPGPKSHRKGRNSKRNVMALKVSIEKHRLFGAKYLHDVLMGKVGDCLNQKQINVTQTECSLNNCNTLAESINPLEGSLPEIDQVVGDGSAIPSKNRVTCSEKLDKDPSYSGRGNGDLQDPLSRRNGKDSAPIPERKTVSESFSESFLNCYTGFEETQNVAGVSQTDTLVFGHTVSTKKIGDISGKKNEEVCLSAQCDDAPTPGVTALFRNQFQQREMSMKSLVAHNKKRTELCGKESQSGHVTRKHKKKGKNKYSDVFYGDKKNLKYFSSKISQFDVEKEPSHEQFHGAGASSNTNSLRSEENSVLCNKSCGTSGWKAVETGAFETGARRESLVKTGACKESLVMPTESSLLFDLQQTAPKCEGDVQNKIKNAIETFTETEERNTCKKGNMKLVFESQMYEKIKNVGSQGKRFKSASLCCEENEVTDSIGSGMLARYEKSSISQITEEEHPIKCASSMSRAYTKIDQKCYQSHYKVCEAGCEFQPLSKNNASKEKELEPCGEIHSNKTNPCKGERENLGSLLLVRQYGDDENKQAEDTQSKSEETLEADKACVVRKQEKSHCFSERTCALGNYEPQMSHDSRWEKYNSINQGNKNLRTKSFDHFPFTNDEDAVLSCSRKPNSLTNHCSGAKSEQDILGLKFKSVCDHPLCLNVTGAEHHNISIGKRKQVSNGLEQRKYDHGKYEVYLEERNCGSIGRCPALHHVQQDHSACFSGQEHRRLSYDSREDTFAIIPKRKRRRSALVLQLDSVFEQQSLTQGVARLNSGSTFDVPCKQCGKFARHHIDGKCVFIPRSVSEKCREYWDPDCFKKPCEMQAETCVEEKTVTDSLITEEDGNSSEDGVLKLASSTLEREDIEALDKIVEECGVTLYEPRSNPPRHMSDPLDRQEPILYKSVCSSKPECTQRSPEQKITPSLERIREHKVAPSLNYCACDLAHVRDPRLKKSPFSLFKGESLSLTNYNLSSSFNSNVWDSPYDPEEPISSLSVDSVASESSGSEESSEFVCVK